VQAFLCVIRKVAAHYGLTLEQLRGANVSLPMASWYVRLHTVAGWLRGDLNFYYFTRYALNVNQKTVERCSINEPDMHPLVRKILKNHAIDEARHMQMSRATGKVALARMGLMRTPGCVGFAHFAARLYIGRHAKDGALQRGTRTNTLALVGVPRPRAEQAYLEWRDRKNQHEDPPLVRAGRRYYVRQMFEYVDELDVAPRLRAYMKRVIGTGYADVAGDFAGAKAGALEFPELTRE
jgi:hypothetical protein